MCIRVYISHCLVLSYACVLVIALLFVRICIGMGIDIRLRFRLIACLRIRLIHSITRIIRRNLRITSRRRRTRCRNICVPI